LLFGFRKVDPAISETFGVSLLLRASECSLVRGFHVVDLPMQVGVFRSIPGKLFFENAELSGIYPAG